MVRQSFLMVLFVVALIASGFTPAAHGVIVPFTENFDANASNWYDSAGAAPVNWVSSGGPDGGSYVSSSFNFGDQTPGLPFPNNAVNIFRAQDEFASSNHAFEGNWIEAGGTELRFWVRHNAAAPMNFFARLSTPANFPAWSAVEFTPVAPNVWTQVSLTIAFGDPGLFFEGPPPTMANFNQVFSNIGHVQIGAFGGAMAGVDQSVTFDIDQVSLVPAPGALALLGFTMLVGRRRNRR